MKYATIITQTITASALVLGMAAQATAADTDHALVNIGGTTEGNHVYHAQAEDGQAVQYQGHHSYRTTFEAGSPALGGTREGIHRERVEVEGRQITSQQVDQSDHIGTGTGNPTVGTRG
ncbi:hypothetical protein HVA01_00860 [Halovibrio variabilis]|uniref:Uncharacterized protein n=1 Tax=Halovibrio variabilis TaxID=31910 RepID=A0A511UIP2_9GAMM|nr:hypothetical protein [Halovibrio variabilis]GEN26440.1 hypothetical protein HVA01_00860 [Halovibrio variabilis]